MNEPKDGEAMERDDDLLEGHAGDPDADPAAVDPDHTPDPDYREEGQD
ncbi:MAG TPA: hypothetical protein VH593_06325 [Ktedonobacteraceae bacterium]|jgi:hypothetical protein